MLVASKPWLGIVQVAPTCRKMRASAPITSGKPIVSIEDRMTMYSAPSTSTGIFRPVSCSWSSIWRLSAGQRTPIGLPVSIARPAALYMSSGAKPAADIASRARRTSAAMSMPIGQTNVQRPHRLHES